MDPQKKEPSAAGAGRAKSVESLQATKSGKPGEPLQPTISVARKNRWLFASLIALILLVALTVIGYLLQSDSAGMLEGLGAALCAIACGGLLVRHALRVMAEEDKLEEEQLNANQTTVPPPEPNPAGQQTNITMPRPDAGQDIK